MRPEVLVYAPPLPRHEAQRLNVRALLSSLTRPGPYETAQLGAEEAPFEHRHHHRLRHRSWSWYFEYSHKVHDGLLWGPNFNPKEQVWETHSFREKHPEAAEYAEHLVKAAESNQPVGAPGAMPAGAQPGAVPGAAGHEAAAPKRVEKPTEAQLEPLIQAGVIGPKAEFRDLPSRPRNAHVFFSVYFFMTGLHGIHVLVGIGIWIWMFTKARRGVFGPNYFGPIDYAALYWHLVDLIWIYLFPLLYLIH
jgi:hypothetical protein